MKLSQITDEGAIKQMTMFDDVRTNDRPDRWCDVPRVVRSHRSSQQEVTLTLYYRPRPLPSVCAGHFATLLSQAPHALSKQEIEDVDLVFRNAAYPEYFDMQSARTEDLRGRCVLVYDGVWLSTQLRNLGIFFPLGQETDFVQAIHYVAPADVFAAHLGEAKACLASIDWQEPE